MRLNLTPTTMLQPPARVFTAAKNAFEVIRHGGFQTDELGSPYVVVDEGRHHRLRRYFDTEDKADRPVVVLVPPLMVVSDVYDVARAVSAVAILHAHGADPWVVDFGAPESEPGGLERRIADHVLAVNEAVDRVSEITGRQVHLAGYSQGGIIAYETVAYRRGKDIASVITFGSPADTSMPFGLPQHVVAPVAQLAVRLSGERAVPGWATRLGFQLLAPAKTIQARADFVRRLDDREALLPRERQRRFVEQEGWVAWPGPAVRDFVDDLFAHNRVLEGGLAVGGHMVSLAEIDCPVLAFVGEQDAIAVPSSVRAIGRAAPKAEAYEVTLRAGHMGLVVSSLASQATWPTVAAWAMWLEGRGSQPELVTPVGPSFASAPTGAVALGASLASQLGEAVRTVAGVGTHGVQVAREFGHHTLTHLPRMAHLERIQPHTRVSIGELVDEQAHRGPDEIFFLYQDRGFTRGQVKQRIDAIVRGLIALGVRPGDHVGVLMDTRPTALAITVALNRLGAVAVMLRPDGDLPREAELGQVVRIIADPERAAFANSLERIDTVVLGGGAERELALPLTDLEQLDTDSVVLPRWYRANPGRGDDLAFVLFTGEGDATRVHRVTNRRWAMSALRTASSAALSARDSLYSLTPLHHPSGLLMSVGGAIAGGCRLAMATSFDPDTFWDEARRYGVTVASYTWTLLAGLIDAPPSPAERHHAIRLFIGSGMPVGLRRRLEERFTPARVMEFYACTQAGVALADPAGRKPGSIGRPLSGTVPLRVARYDADRGRLAEGSDGCAVECATDENGMLLARVDAPVPDDSPVLRSVFEPGDAWHVTGDLVRRDADGDYWLQGPARDLIHTDAGPVAPRAIQDALGDIPAVGQAVAYGIALPGAKRDVAAAAVTVHPGDVLKETALTKALAVLEPSQQPAVIRVVKHIPLTAAYRPYATQLRLDGLPTSDNGSAFYRDTSGRYRSLTQASLRRLVGYKSTTPTTT